ncbi:MAG: hypothetical protein ACK5YR_18360 [Pirellula sp.]|jgi:hypothetical protein
MNLASRLFVASILCVVLTSTVGAQSRDSSAKNQATESKTQLKMEANQNSLDDAIAKLRDLGGKSYHSFLRESYRLLPPQCLEKPWSEINEHFVEMGLSTMESWENGSAIHRYYRLKSNAISFPGCRSTDLWLLLSARNTDEPNYAVKPGSVYKADVAIVSTINTSYQELIEAKPYPANSVLDTVLRSDEVSSVGATWPIVHRVYIHYGYIANRWLEHNPNGFHVTIEFVASLKEKIAGKRINFFVPSGLDPMRTHLGEELADPTFVASDTLGDVQSGGGGEWWHGEPHVIETNRKKYLNTHSK